MKGKGEFPHLNAKQPDGIKPGGKPYRVMVVEEKEFLRKQIVQILESEGYAVVATAGNGQEALDKFELLRGDLDLITTTLDMPILDGYAMLYALNEKKKRPPVVFVSEETTKGVMQDLIKGGIADFILKPLDRRVFLQRIKAVLVKELAKQRDKEKQDIV